MPAMSSGNTCPSSLALSNSNANTYVSCTFTVSNPGANGGILLEITAITNSADHPRDISIVQNAYASNYDAGAIFNPAFIIALSGFSSLRFMEWMKTNNEFSGYANTGRCAAGATSLTLASAWISPFRHLPGTVHRWRTAQRHIHPGLHNGQLDRWSLQCDQQQSGSNWQWGNQIYYAPFFVINKPGRVAPCLRMHSGICRMAFRSRSSSRCATSFRPTAISTYR